MAREFDNDSDVIDSRDVIERLEELEAFVHTEPDIDPYPAASKWETMSDEIDALRGLISEAEGSGDWQYGEALIRDSYFEDYAKQMAEDIGAIQADAPWPVRHIDWAAAAEELQQDYTSVDFDGETYWIRS